MIKVIILILIFSFNAFALEKNNIQSFMEEKINLITDILRDKTKSIEKQDKEIFSHISHLFDFNIMSKISLSKKYKSLSKKEKQDFYDIFKEKLKTSYLDKLHLYSNEKTIFEKLKQTKKNRIILKTKLLGATDSFNINYKFYKNKKQDWLIYDIELLGISVLQTYRKQFKEYLYNHSISELINTLKK